MPDVSSIGPKRPCRRPRATLHGVVFDIFGWEPWRRGVVARILLEAAPDSEAFAVAQMAHPTRFEPVTIAFVKVLAFPINPADLLTMQGVYPRLDLSTQAIRRPAAAVGARGKSGDLVALQAGDWIIQNAANSGVSRAVIQLARLRGIRTVNVVRRSDLVDELKSLGGDAVLLDGEDLAARVETAMENAPIRFGIDSVGGQATNRIASCLGPGATLVLYGAMSGEPAVIAPGTIVFNDLRLRGLWLSKYLQSAPRDAIDALYGGLDELSVSGRLVAKIDSVFRADGIKSAIRRASQPGIDGIVIVTFN